MFFYGVLFTYNRNTRLMINTILIFYEIWDNDQLIMDMDVDYQYVSRKIF